MSIFGPLLGPWDVELATLAVLSTWIDTYLSEVERAHGLTARTLPRPPAADSFYGGVDLDSWEEDQTPAVIAVCKPVGPPELSAAAGYGQQFEAQVGAVIIADDEQQTRMIAGFYAAAIAGTVIQHGDLGGIATRTRLAGAPTVEFPNPDIRRLAYGVCTFQTFVQPIVLEDAGPAAPDPPPTSGGTPTTPPDNPQVASTTVAVHGVPLAGS